MINLLNILPVDLIDFSSFSPSNGQSTTVILCRLYRVTVYGILFILFLS